VDANVRECQTGDTTAKAAQLTMEHNIGMIAVVSNKHDKNDFPAR
jgi:hypothetical protein